MKFDFTEEMLREVINDNAETGEWYDELLEVLPEYNIDTPRRVAGFIAQCAHESGDFRCLEENLNYSEGALNRVFSRYFGPGKRSAADYARKPEDIANYVYMDKYRSAGGALGNVVEGDGWRFRGRGLKQLTGRANYEAFARSVNMTADEAAEYLGTKKGTIESACWFWDTKNLNQPADDKDVARMTRIINGGLIGLGDRTKRFKHALALFRGEVTVEKYDIDFDQVVQRGVHGEIVEEIQKKLGVLVDGAFGYGTRDALARWQKRHGLNPDGIAGPYTLKKLFT
jgi:putative chitinase